MLWINFKNMEELKEIKITISIRALLYIAATITLGAFLWGVVVAAIFVVK